MPPSTPPLLCPAPLCLVKGLTIILDPSHQFSEIKFDLLNQCENGFEEVLISHQGVALHGTQLSQCDGLHRPPGQIARRGDGG